MDDAEFDDLLDEYLDGTLAPNLEMADVEIIWVDNNPHFGALHMLRKHNVQKHEVEEVLFGTAARGRSQACAGQPWEDLFLGRHKGGTVSLCGLRGSSPREQAVLDPHHSL